MPRKRRRLLKLMATIRQRAPLLAGRGSVTASLADTNPPTVPTELVASAASSSQINLSWGASTDTTGLVQSGVASYRIYRGGSLLTTVTGTNHQDTGLTASTTYSYTVAAVDNYGNASAQSGAVQATTQAQQSTGIWLQQGNPGYLSAIPGVVAYGLNTTAGANVTRNGIAAASTSGTRILYVDRLGDSATDGGTPANHGTLRWCIGQHNARSESSSKGTTIVFKVSGTISAAAYGAAFDNVDTAKNLRITRSRLTVAGQTAPAPGIQIKGMGFFTSNSAVTDILIQHLRIRPGMGPQNAWSCDSYSNTAINRRMVLDHCSFQWGRDEINTFYGDNRDCSFVSCLSSEAIRWVNDGGGIESYITLAGQDQGVSGRDLQSSQNIQWLRCYMAAAGARFPTCHAGSAIMANCWAQSWGLTNVAGTEILQDSAAQWNVGNGGDDGEPLTGRKLSIVATVYCDGPLSRSDKPIKVRVNSQPTYPHKLWINGCEWRNTAGAVKAGYERTTASQGSNQWQFTYNENGTPPASVIAASISESLSPPTGAVLEDTVGLLDKLKATVGCRPAELRDVVDQRALDYSNPTTTGPYFLVASETQTSFVSKMSSLGLLTDNGTPWPTLAPNTTTHEDIPANPDAIQPSGYTALEEWLHAKARAVEGTA